MPFHGAGRPLSYNQKGNTEMKELNPIREIRYVSMHNGEAVQVFARLLAVYERVTLALLLPFILAFRGAYDAFAAAFRQQAASPITPVLDRYERLRDHTLTDLFHSVETATLSPDAGVIEAARTLGGVLNRYGNPSAKPHDEQTGIIAEMVKDLRVPELDYCYLALPAVKLTVGQLSDANTAYSILYDKRITEMDKRDVGATERHRRETDAAAHAAAVALNSYANLFDEPSLEPVIHLLNTIYTDTRHTLNRIAAHSGDPEPEAGTEPGPAEEEGKR